ncbi:MAG TPA: ABC transporter ATP-binding protein [Tepidisphaeraceae bacterium]|nr:ABC transporter ATP-binding protein [Tepidisphaeraceae bacterium]
MTVPPAADPQTALASRDLHAGYGAGPHVLRGVSASFAPGRVCALCGPNGAGKTTLLRCLLGLVAPRAGTVTVGDADLQSLSARARAARLAYVPQRPDVAFEFTAREVVELGAAMVAPARARECAAAALERVGASDLAERVFAHLSVGQQQRVSLARALAQLAASPPGVKFLLADEPVAALDPAHALRTLSLLRRVALEDAGSVGVVCILHDLGLARRFCDDAVLLGAEGRTAAAGRADEVLTPGLLGHVFGATFALADAPGAASVRTIVAVSADAGPEGRS